MVLAVVSNPRQYKALRKSKRLSGSKIICDNLSFQGFLRERKVDFELLEESLLKEQWDAINVWACDRALNWDALLGNNKSLFDGIELNQALYVHFSYYLIAILKNYLYAEYLCTTYKPEEVIVFLSDFRPRFPAFDGNYLLNLFLKNLSARFNYTVHCFNVAGKPRKQSRQALKRLIKFFIQWVYFLCSRPISKKGEFIACGSLKHLADVIQGIRQQGSSLMLFDFSFHLEQMLFCLKRHIPYLVSAFLRNASNKPINTYQDDFMYVIDCWQKSRWFTFQARDLTDMLCAELRPSSGHYLKKIMREAALYSRIFKLLKPQALITDEDWSPTHGFMCAFFKSRGTKTFCVSHGYGYQRFSLEQSKRRFFLTETLVNSEFERSLFACRGWDKAHIHVTGSPKYDRLLSIKEAYVVPRNTKPTILFCGTTPRDYTLNQVSYIGVMQFQRGEYMRSSLKCVLEAVAGFDVRLVIRPHPSDTAVAKSLGINEKKLWAELVTPYGAHRDVVISDVRVPFHELLAGCNAMIIGYWSQTIVEALLVGVPTLVLNPCGITDGFPFACEGLCEASSDFSHLKDFIRRVYSDFKSRGKLVSPSTPPEKRAFYLGNTDRANAQRAVKMIFALLKETIAKRQGQR